MKSHNENLLSFKQMHRMKMLFDNADMLYGASVVTFVGAAVLFGASISAILIISASIIGGFALSQSVRNYAETALNAHESYRTKFREELKHDKILRLTHKQARDVWYKCHDSVVARSLELVSKKVGCLVVGTQDMNLTLDVGLDVKNTETLGGTECNASALRDEPLYLIKQDLKVIVDSLKFVPLTKRPQLKHQIKLMMIAKPH